MDRTNQVKNIGQSGRINEEKLYWLGFSALEGIGPKRFALLIDYFGSAKAAWKAAAKELLQIGLGSSLTEKIIVFRKKFSPEKYWQQLIGKKIGWLFSDQPDYPSNLTAIVDPPFVLYVKGEITKTDRRALAVVGTRKMTPYGGQAAESLTAELAGMGLTIVSGLARGIDSVAHRTALSVRGRTIAVLGSAIDVVYPWENKELAEEIARGNGAVVSEYALGTLPRPGNFPARNRLISGLSLGTLVIEGGENSGSLITARYAAEQGREVFAVPGPIYSPNTAAPAHLVQLGAKLVLSVKDILTELNLDYQNETSETNLPKLSLEEELVLSLLENGPREIDELIRESGLDAGSLISLVTMLEIKGKVKNSSGIIYSQ